MKILMLALALVGCANSSPKYHIADRTVAYVSCGNWMGTAVKIGKSKYLTARHVVEMNAPGKTACSINGVAITDVVMNPNNDSATFTGPASDDVALFSCKGTNDFGHYLAMGYAEGRTELTYEPLIASDIAVEGMTAFFGNLYHGMSGGPIIDEHGVVTAIVNKGHPNSGLEVKDTSLCTTSMKR